MFFSHITLTAASGISTANGVSVNLYMFFFQHVNTVHLLSSLYLFEVTSHPVLNSQQSLEHCEPVCGRD